MKNDKEMWNGGNTFLGKVKEQVNKNMNKKTKISGMGGKGGPIDAIKGKVTK